MSSGPLIKLIASATPISQGAEAKVYQAKLTPSAPPILIKYRFPKQYRHASLDASLTRSRVAGEARALLKCLRSGVSVPGIRMVDAAEGALGIEWIEGESVRRLLPGGSEEGELDASAQAEDLLKEYDTSLDALMVFIGVELGKMHTADVIHGDLTTSNIMLRRPTSFQSQDYQSQLVLIDFGLSYISNLVEDKAVDLYVLERAFSSTHPDSEPLFASILSAYAKQVGTAWVATGKRLDDVRLRGRKRSMVG